MKAIDILNKLIGRVTWVDRYKARPGHPGMPGEVVKHLSQEDREELQNLKSSDIDSTKIRDEDIG